jgi:site-specific DNA recombinase
MSAKNKTKQTAAAAVYIRKSGGKGKQEASIPQQKEELTKLAQREGLSIPDGLWFTDEVSGDNGVDQRPGFARMLKAAESGKFKVLLCWHSNRLSREDPMESFQHFNRLRKAGVRIRSVSEGWCDPSKFVDQLLLLVRGREANEFLTELAGKVTRGMANIAREGWWCGGDAPHGLDRAEFTPHGKLVRRLGPGEVKARGHKVGLVKSEDGDAVAAVEFAFKRFDRTRLPFNRLARELDAKGYSSPKGTGWTGSTVKGMLQNPCYCSMMKWAGRITAKYKTIGRDGEIVEAETERRPSGRVKSRLREEGAILVKAPWAAAGTIIPPGLFESVNRKIEILEKRQYAPRATYLLHGILICRTCGRPLSGKAIKRANRHGQKVYAYRQYACSTYSRYGATNPCGCGPSTIQADQIERFVRGVITRDVLRSDREALAAFIEDCLAERANGGDAEEAKRLAARLEKVDKRVAALVKTIGVVGKLDEAIKALEAASAERNALKASLDAAGRFSIPAKPALKARELADAAWDAWEAALADGDQATLRDWLRSTVRQIKVGFVSADDAGRGLGRKGEFSVGYIQLANRPERYLVLGENLADPATELVRFADDIPIEELDSFGECGDEAFSLSDTRGLARQR